MSDILCPVYEHKSKPQVNQQTRILSSGYSPEKDPYFLQFHLKKKKERKQDICLSQIKNEFSRGCVFKPFAKIV